MEMGGEERQTKNFYLRISSFIPASFFSPVSLKIDAAEEQPTTNCCSCGQMVMTSLYLPYLGPDLSIAYLSQMSFKRPQKEADSELAIRWH